MNTDGKLLTQIKHTILKLFPTEEELKIMLVEKLNRSLDNISVNNYEAKVYHLIMDAKRRGELEELIKAVGTINPEDPDWQEIANSFKIKPESIEKDPGYRPFTVIKPLPSPTTRRRQVLVFLGLGAATAGGIVVVSNLHNLISPEEPLQPPKTPSPVNGPIQVPGNNPSPDNFTNRIGMEMVGIPSGSFIMGSPLAEEGRYDNEGPQRIVTVTPFYLGKYEVTQAQWRQVAGLPTINRWLEPDPSRFKGDNLPVEKVSWEHAVEFCARLSKFTGKTYRLPSEAEWEYACRAGTTTPFYFGSTISTDIANYNGNIYGDGIQGVDRDQTTNVGSFSPNKFGLYDMHGNVYEWCQDSWHGDYEGAPSNSKAWEGGSGDTRKVIRGGSWDSDPRNCRSADRGTTEKGSGDRHHHVGFRVAMSF